MVGKNRLRQTKTTKHEAEPGKPVKQPQKTTAPSKITEPEETPSTSIEQNKLLNKIVKEKEDVQDEVMHRVETPQLKGLKF